MKQRERQERSKNGIIEAAFEEFAEKGYDAATMDGICLHGISKGMLYHYFSNKDELFMTCLGIVFTGLQSYIEEHKQSIRIEPAFEAIKSYYMLREDYFQLHPRQRPLFVNAVLRPPRQLADDISKLRDPIKRLNRSFMNRVISKGNMRDGTDREYIASYLQIIEVYFWDMVSQFYSGDGDDKATMLFRAEKLLDMLDEDYDDLHGMGMEYLMQLFDEYLEGAAL